MAVWKSTNLLLTVFVAWLALVTGKRVLVEMSHPYNNRTASPPDPEMWSYELINKHKGPWEGHGNVWFEMNNYKMNEHAGTHVDAPTHFNKNGWDPAEIPLDKLYDLPVVVVDISAKALKDPHAQLQPDDLMAWETRHGKIPEGAAIFVNSEWSKKYGSSAYMAIERNVTTGDITDMRFPSVSPAAAQWLVDNRPTISCVGIDTTSLEYEPGFDYPAHRILLGRNIYIIENLANPQLLPASGARVTIMPLRLSGGSGAAARIVGVYDDDIDDGNSVTAIRSGSTVIVASALMSLLATNNI